MAIPYVVIKRYYSQTLNSVIPLLKNFLLSNNYPAIKWIESDATKNDNNDFLLRSSSTNKKGKHIYLEFYYNTVNNYLEFHQYHPDLFDPNIGNQNFDNIVLSDFRGGSYDLYNSTNSQKIANGIASLFTIINAGKYIICSIQGIETNTIRFNTSIFINGSLESIGNTEFEFYLNSKNLSYTYTGYCIGGYQNIKKGFSYFNTVVLGYSNNINSTGINYLSQQLSGENPIWQSKILCYESNNEILFDYEILYQIPLGLQTGTQYQIGTKKYFVFYGSNSTGLPGFSVQYNELI
ncbi:MAG: hypothetical protein QXO40_04570 [Candidatus Aenigmatarchaeota archaeon]